MPDIEQSSDDLLAEIAARRNDAEFMERLREIIAVDRDVLDRLAQHSEDCLNQAFQFHAATGGDADCACGVGNG
jgi:hypothetical protein